MSDILYEVRRALRLVGPKALLNAATGAAEGLLRRPSPRCLPTSLDIVLTKACNLRCIFCISYDSLDDVHWMDFDVYKRIARELFPTTLGIFICSGGEPLLYPHLREALQLAKQHRTMATMTSNGMLLNRETAAWMVADQSLQELCISFDGAQKQTLERIRRGANYEQILQNIDYLAKCKTDKRAEFPRLWFRFAIMRSNALELPEMLRLCKEHGLYKVEVKYLNVANDIPFDESLYNHPQLASEVFAEAQAKAKEYGVRVALPPLPGSPHKPYKCVKPWEFAQIDTDGSIRICYYCWKQRLGRVQDGFASVWRGPHYQKIRATIDSDTPYYPYCKHCVVRLGPESQSSHDRTLHEDTYTIPGLEHLCIGFNQRAEENAASFKQMKQMKGNEES